MYLHNQKGKYYPDGCGRARAEAHSEPVMKMVNQCICMFYGLVVILEIAIDEYISTRQTPGNTLDIEIAWIE